MVLMASRFHVSSLFGPFKELDLLILVDPLQLYSVYEIGRNNLAAFVATQGKMANLPFGSADL